MKLNYLKTATFAPEIKVCDTEYNAAKIIDAIKLADKEKVELLVLPELCVVGCTAGDLIKFSTLLDGADKAVKDIAAATAGKNLIVFVGAPVRHDGAVFSSAICIRDGKILGIVPKSYNFSNVVFINAFGQDDIPMGKNVTFKASGVNLKLGAEIGSELFDKYPPSIDLENGGCNVIVNTYSEYEYSGAAEKRALAVRANSERLGVAYVLSNAGKGESTTDGVFSGHGIICERGEVVSEKKPFESGLNVNYIDLDGFAETNREVYNNEVYEVKFHLKLNGESERGYERLPFIKDGEEELLLNIQARGLAKRIEHTHSKTLVLGLSGGLDSTLALIACDRAMTILGRDKKDIITVTMPCFGTSSRTLDNSIRLAKAFGTTLKKIDLTKAVKRHLKDIGHDGETKDAAYENAQARERTQVLMDMANMYNGLVVGTGDLSELALGFATYNGDHMSMYAVNASIPKTLVRHLSAYSANNLKGKAKSTIMDIIDTPVSPELIPSGDKTIVQVTEDIVGPYILHDFFLYNMLKRGFSPKKIYTAAVNTFKGEFDGQTIIKWLKVFVRRFFTQQFKRSCMPDGVKATELSLSPRSGFKMPSDAVFTLWQQELDDIRVNS